MCDKGDLVAKGPISNLVNSGKKYLSVCATGCPSERVFSTGGNVVTPCRSYLKPDKVDKLVF